MDNELNEKERQTELDKLIKEQDKDKRVYKIDRQIFGTAHLKQERIKAAKELREKLKDTKGKREFRYALIRFMDDIGVNRKYISEVLKVSFRSIKRVIYENVQKPPTRK